MLNYIVEVWFYVFGNRQDVVARVNGCLVNQAKKTMCHITHIMWLGDSTKTSNRHINVTFFTTFKNHPFMIECLNAIFIEF